MGTDASAQECNEHIVNTLSVLAAGHPTAPPCPACMSSPKPTLPPSAKPTNGMASRATAAVPGHPGQREGQGAGEGHCRLDATTTPPSTCPEAQERQGSAVGPS